MANRQTRSWLTAEQVAAALGITPKTLRKYVREGNALVPDPIPGSKPHKWLKADIDAVVCR